jgi:mannose-6-phosphate isomerase-like protein (cupin superfamily)
MVDTRHEAHTFKYELPRVEKPKTIVWLARTDHLFADVQVITQGGETNLHSHSHLDGFWFVLSGRARFYGEGDRVLGELGKHEGILLPRGTPYWFESASDEPLELLQLEASDIPIRTQSELMADRVNYTAPTGRAADQVEAPRS